MRSDSFPDDDILRIVYAIGSMPKTNDFISNPLVNVFTALFPTKKNTDKKEKTLLIQIPVSELDIVRVGSVWRGQQKLFIGSEGYFEFRSFIDGDVKYVEDNFCINEIPSNNRLERWYSDKDNPLIPYQYFKLPPNKTVDGKNDYANCINIWNSYCNVFEYNKILYIIPCMEIFSSLYAPMRKDLRRMIMTHSKDSILSTYIDQNNRYFNKFSNKEITLKLKTNLGDSSTVFLGHLLLDDHTSSMFDIIKNSLDTSEDDKNIYPQVKPYFIGKTKIEGKGIWLNSEKTRMLVLRINSFALPTNIKVKILEERNVIQEEEKNYKFNKELVVERVLVSESDLNITASISNENQDRKSYILTEVQTTVADGIITRTTELKYSTNTNTSSDEDEDGAEDNDEYVYGIETTEIVSPENEIMTDIATGKKCKHYGNKKLKEVDIKEKFPTNNPERVPFDVFDAIVKLKKGDKKILYKIVTNEGKDSEQVNDFIISYNAKFPEIKTTKWVVKNNTEYREILLLQFYFLSDRIENLNINKKYYLLEIIRRDINDKNTGYILIADNSLDQEKLNFLLEVLAEKKGILKKKDLLEHSIIVKPFKHNKGNMSWHDKMKKTLMEKLSFNEVSIVKVI